MKKGIRIADPGRSRGFVLCQLVGFAVWWESALHQDLIHAGERLGNPLKALRTVPLQINENSC